MKNRKINLHLFHHLSYLRKASWRQTIIHGKDIENTRWVSFDIKFTRQGFENACWPREACRAIQNAFSKPSLVNFISKTQTWYSIYHFTHWFTLQTGNYEVIFDVWVDSVSLATTFKSATSPWPDKGTCHEIDNVYQAMCNNAVNMKGNW